MMSREVDVIADRHRPLPAERAGKNVIVPEKITISAPEKLSTHKVTYTTVASRIDTGLRSDWGAKVEEQRSSSGVGSVAEGSAEIGPLGSARGRSSNSKQLAQQSRDVVVTARRRAGSTNIVEQEEMESAADAQHREELVAAQKLLGEMESQKRQHDELGPPPPPEEEAERERQPKELELEDKPNPMEKSVSYGLHKSCRAPARTAGGSPRCPPNRCEQLSTMRPGRSEAVRGGQVFRTNKHPEADGLHGPENKSSGITNQHSRWQERVLGQERMKSPLERKFADKDLKSPKGRLGVLKELAGKLGSPGGVVQELWSPQCEKKKSQSPSPRPRNNNKSQSPSPRRNREGGGGVQLVGGGSNTPSKRRVEEPKEDAAVHLGSVDASLQVLESLRSLPRSPLASRRTRVVNEVGGGRVQPGSGQPQNFEDVPAVSPRGEMLNVSRSGPGRHDQDKVVEEQQTSATNGFLCGGRGGGVAPAPAGGVVLPEIAGVKAAAAEPFLTEVVAEQHCVQGGTPDNRPLLFYPANVTATSSSSEFVAATFAGCTSGCDVEVAAPEDPPDPMINQGVITPMYDSTPRLSVNNKSEDHLLKRQGAKMSGGKSPSAAGVMLSPLVRNYLGEGGEGEDWNEHYNPYDNSQRVFRYPAKRMKQEAGSTRGVGDAAQEAEVKEAENEAVRGAAATAEAGVPTDRWTDSSAKAEARSGRSPTSMEIDERVENVDAHQEGRPDSGNESDRAVAARSGGDRRAEVPQTSFASTVRSGHGRSLEEVPIRKRGEGLSAWDQFLERADADQFLADAQHADRTPGGSTASASVSVSVSSLLESASGLLHRAENGLWEPVSWSAEEERQQEQARVPCEHCGRSFAPAAAERHIPKCAKIAEKQRGASSSSKKISSTGPRTFLGQGERYVTDRLGRRVKVVATNTMTQDETKQDRSNQPDPPGARAASNRESSRQQLADQCAQVKLILHEEWANGLGSASDDDLETKLLGDRGKKVAEMRDRTEAGLAWVREVQQLAEQWNREDEAPGDIGGVAVVGRGALARFLCRGSGSSSSPSASTAAIESKNLAPGLLQRLRTEAEKLKGFVRLGGGTKLEDDDVDLLFDSLLLLKAFLKNLAELQPTTMSAASDE
eukprot:g6566.t1